MIYVFSFLTGLQFFGAVAVPFYIVRMGFSYTQMFSMEMIFSVSLFLFEIPTGIIADRWGRKISLVFGAVLLGCSFIVLGITHVIAVFVVMQVLSACGVSLISGADRALVYEISRAAGKNDDSAAVVAARYSACNTAGMLLAFPAGSIFAASGSLPYPIALGSVFVATGICIVCAGCAILFVRESYHIKQYSAQTAVKNALKGFTCLFKNRQLFRFSLNYAVVSALTFLMFWFYQSLLSDAGIPVGWNGFIAAGFNGGGMLLLLATGYINRKVGTRRALFLSSFLPGIFYLLLFLAPSAKPLIFVSVFGIIMLRIFRAPLLTTLINTQIADGDRATILSGVSMVERIVISLLYPVAGFLMDYSPRWTYFVVGGVTIIFSFVMNTTDKS
jgi:MFS family permease